MTALNHYDPLGRLIRTDLPNGTFSTVESNPWMQTTWDPNDNVLASDWYAARYDYGGTDPSLVAEKRAALLAAGHDNTPSVVHLDTLGRPFLSVAHNKDDQGASLYYETKSVLDIQGNVLGVIDARGLAANPSYYAEQRTYGMLGQSLVVESHDAGDRWHLLNALGQPMRTWDSRSQRFSFTYDTLRRPVDRTVSVSGGSEKLLGRIVYGDLLSSPADTNHACRVYRVYDGAGVATTVAYDFKGDPTSEQRQLVTSKTTQPDWSALLGQSTISAMATAAASLLDAETFSASSERDALGRVVVALSPDDSEVLYTYDEGGELQAVDLEHRGSTTAQPVVGDITYNARGQREQVVYGSTSSPTMTTSYGYDPQTYRLAHMTTIRESDDASLQGLHYHYDPAGNITNIRDTAQQTVYYQNSVVEAANSYEYDAVYRLIEATGREHSTQGTTQRTHEQLPVGPQPMTSDPSAMRRYTQKYTYDSVGNILTMQHIPASGSGWTRHYEYDEGGNRLEATSAPSDSAQGPYTHTYSYDTHGSMTAMPHLSSMVWNHDDELREVTVGTETVYIQYAGGIRSRKYTEKSGTTTEERIYLGPFELYRKRVNGSLDLERESLHISEGIGRICIVETKTVGGGNPVATPTGIWRYQLGNHLGSASTEVDGTGAVISHEEYHPYGTSAYRAVNSSVDVSARRYRYTGMERDEETSLDYHSARYYVPWLGRWTAGDPIGIRDGLNRYAYVGGRVIQHTDNTGLFRDPIEMKSPNKPTAPPEGESGEGDWYEVGSYTTIKQDRGKHESGEAEGEQGSIWRWVSSLEQSDDAEDIPQDGTLAHEATPPPERHLSLNYSKEDPPVATSAVLNNLGDLGDGAAELIDALKDNLNSSSQGLGNSARLTWDSTRRIGYTSQIKANAEKFHAALDSLPDDAPTEQHLKIRQEAHAARNTTLDATRERLSRPGKLASQAIKEEGKSLSSLVDRYATKLGHPQDSKAISKEIVRASGRSNPTMTRMAKVGRALGPAGVALAVGVAGYNVATAAPSERGRVLAREATTIAAGAAGGWLGAMAGAGLMIALGVSAPIAVISAVLLFTLIGTFTSSHFAQKGFDRLWPSSM